MPKHKIMLKEFYMKILVLSDSHGDIYNLKEVLRIHRDANAVCFLGDGLRDVDALYREVQNSAAWICVRGNCDFYNLFDGCAVGKNAQIEYFGKRILLTHGDLYSAKYGLGGLISLAREREADVVLYGHTHIPKETYVNEERPIYLFNPGSICYPNGSYGLITLDEGGILFSHGKI